MKAHGLNQLKVHPLSKFWFSDVINPHPYIEDEHLKAFLTAAGPFGFDITELDVSLNEVGPAVQPVGWLKAPPRLNNARNRSTKTIPVSSAGFKLWFQAGACTPTTRGRS